VRAPLGPAVPPPPVTLNLALQGGGAHGAFTWGVLDRLLEDGRIALEGVSGTSAGAVNAVLLASGWLAAGRAGARRALDAFWDRLANLAAASSFPPALGLLARTLSPYQFNPLDLNPLRALLTELVNFAAIRRADEPRLFVAATRVRTGEARIFRNRELSVEAVLALQLWDARLRSSLRAAHGLVPAVGGLPHAANRRMIGVRKLASGRYPCNSA
jgi:NTE family protein